MQATTLDTGLSRDAGVSGALCSLHVVLGSSSAGFRVFLVEGDAFGFAHEGELDVDAVEEFRRPEAGVGGACSDGGEFGPVAGDEYIFAALWTGCVAMQM